MSFIKVISMENQEVLINPYYVFRAWEQDGFIQLEFSSGERRWLKVHKDYTLDEIHAKLEGRDITTLHPAEKRQLRI